MMHVIILFMGFLYGVNCVPVVDRRNDLIEMEILEDLPFPFALPFPLEALDLENKRNKEEDGCYTHEKCQTSLSLENALLRTYIAKSELNASTPEETIDNIQQIIENLMDVQDCLQKEDRRPPLFPMSFMNEPKAMKDLVYSIEIQQVFPPTSEKPEVSNMPTMDTTGNPLTTSLAPLESPKPFQTMQMETVTRKQSEDKSGSQGITEGSVISVALESPTDIQKVATESIAQKKLGDKSSGEDITTEELAALGPLLNIAPFHKLEIPSFLQKKADFKSFQQGTVGKEDTASDTSENLPPFLRANKFEPIIEIDIDPKRVKQPFPDDKSTLWKKFLSEYSPEKLEFLKEINNEV